MSRITSFTAEQLLQRIRERALGHVYIAAPHSVFRHLEEKSDLPLLLRYVQEQPPISHQFLVALGRLVLSIIAASREKGKIVASIAEAAFYVAKNLSEELCDPQARRSHVALLGDLQRAILESMGTDSPTSHIAFTYSKATATYEQSTTRGMTNLRTGLLYLTTMEVWMRPEYDMLEIAATKAGIPRSRQIYFDANRDADEDHVVISVQGALALAAQHPRWDISTDELDRVIMNSCSDRSKFWDQFLPLVG